MKSSRVMKIFDQYVKKIDMNNVNIKTKYFHSLKTMELCRDIATTLGIFEEEEIVVCELIGLFHEIGSFDESPNYKISEEENNDIEKTFNLLFEGGLLRKIEEDTKYDRIIKIAIYSYNKFGYIDNITEKEKHFCKVLRDAHYLDTFRLVINYPYIDNRIDTLPSDLVYNDFKSFKIISHKLTDNNADTVIAILSTIFVLNYRYSYYLLKQNNYLIKLYESLRFGNKQIDNFFKQLVKVLDNYMVKKISE